LSELDLAGLEPKLLLFAGNRDPLDKGVATAISRGRDSLTVGRVRQDSNPKLLLFAGGDVTSVFNDLHVLDLETLAWSNP